MKILLDLNVILDVVLDRDPFVADALAVCRECATGRSAGYLAAISLPTLFYLVKKIKHLESAREAVRLCLESFEIAPVTRNELTSARDSQGADFEDNIQIACAVSSGVGMIVTRNAADFSHSPIPVMTPAEWLAKQVS